MLFDLKDFTESDAQSICLWKYESPYDIYNCPSWETSKKEKCGMSDETKRKKEFYSVYESGALAGYFRLIENESYIYMELGLRPDLCGKGLGRELLLLIISTANKRYPGAPLRLEVRDFNVRAKECYEKAGFVKTGTLQREAISGIDGSDIITVNSDIMELKKV